MLRLTHQLLISSLLTLCTLSLGLGQDVKKDPVNKTQIITASVTPDGVRIAAPSAVVQLRLEVYDDAGQKLLDTEQRGGNVLDWHLQGGGGERVADGAYLVVVTIKHPSGRLTQKLGLVTVSAQSTTVRSAGVAELSLRQAQVVGPIEGEDEGLAVTPAEDAPPVTVLAHTGNQAQLTRTRGALSFRVGDFFSANDKEQMRLTQEGNLGIGTTKPKARLDVSGDIRATGTIAASQGITFADGTVQTTGSNGRKDANGNVIPNASGAGTQNQLSRWTDNSGTLGDSIITESPAGYIGIGNTNPTAKFSVSAAPGAELRFDQGALGITPVLSVISQPGSNTMGAASILGAGTGGSSFVFSDNQPFFLVKDTKAHVVNNQLGNGTPLFTLLPTGNVGIGTTSPSAKLDVAGDVKMSSYLTVDTNTLFVDAGNDRVGIGTATPTAGLNVKIGFNTRSAVLIENGNNAGGDVDSAALWIKNKGLGGLVFRADDSSSDSTPFIIDHSGNVGIGTASPVSKLDVVGHMNVNGDFTAAGRVESTLGGFKFPDGSVQTSAAAKSFTTFRTPSIEIGPRGSNFVPILQLDLPAGTYEITATVEFQNTANLFAQNNTRMVYCALVGEALWFSRLGALGSGADRIPVTTHTIQTLPGGLITVSCMATDGGTDRSYVFANARRLTAVRVGDLVTQ